MSKNVEPERPQMTTRHGAYALHAGKTRLHAHPHAYAPGNSRAPTRAQTNTHTHTEICNTYCFSMATMIRKRVSMLRYTYIAALVFCLIFTVCSSPNKLTPQAEILCPSFPIYYDSYPFHTAYSKAKRKAMTQM